jgi:DNA-binding transcriptional ArsR family regulator/DNA-binding PadR family transcriptional regulator
MSHPNSFSGTAFLIADPARAAMLTALLDGRALPAGELAHAAGITAQTASTHLAKLVEGGLLAVETEGRHKYFRLAGAHVAQALEHLAAIAPAAAVRRVTPSPKARELGFCRCCYDHLAGQVGVAVTQALQSHGYLVPMPDKQYEVTPAGVVWFGEVGLNVRDIRPTRRGLARQCLDWTERAHHLAGPLGVQFLRRLCDAGWMLRARQSRAVLVTPKGWQELHRRLGVDEATVRSEAAHRHA